MLQNELLAIQEQIGMTLISELEVHLIREQWAQDEIERLLRQMAA